MSANKDAKTNKWTNIWEPSDCSIVVQMIGSDFCIIMLFLKDKRSRSGRGRFNVVL